ncbi:aryl hydrocarbon receptor-like isoform X1 [Arapaima gigas]
MSSDLVYANRKRRKPVQRSTKPTCAEGVKSNPSKRHRERLNEELETLASLLPYPQDVTSKLDKLTVLRLSVSYLRAKSFFSVTLPSKACCLPDGCSPAYQGEELPEGELLLQLLNGFVLVVTASGTIFYASPTIQDYLGFHQSDIIHQSVYELVHAEDRAEFRRQLHWALDPGAGPDHHPLDLAPGSSLEPRRFYSPEDLPAENSSFLERDFVCRLRCLLNAASGFLAVSVQGRLKFLHGQNQKAEDGSPIPAQLALFAVVTPVQPPSILEIQMRSCFFKTKHKLDFTPTACDTRGHLVLGYTEEELFNSGSGYQFIHTADMLYCAENHLRMMKTGESGVTVFRLLSKRSRWVWVQADARLIYCDGKPDYIIATQKVITDEEGEENLKKRNLKLSFNFATGEAVLYDFALPRLLADSTSSKDTESLDPSSLLGARMKQDASTYVCVPAQNQVPVCPSELTDATGDLGDVPTDDWVGSVLALSKNDAFMQKPRKCFAEDKNVDLLSFMKTLEICKEDLELSQQDEEFWKVSLHDNRDVMDVANEILSYVEEALGKTSDCMFSNAEETVASGHIAPVGTQHQEPQAAPHQQQQQQRPPCELVPQQQPSFVRQEAETGLWPHHHQEQLQHQQVPQERDPGFVDLAHLDHHQQQLPHHQVLQNQELGLLSGQQQHLAHFHHQQELPRQKLPQSQGCGSLLQRQQDLARLHIDQQLQQQLHLLCEQLHPREELQLEEPTQRRLPLWDDQPAPQQQSQTLYGRFSLEASPSGLDRVTQLDATAAAHIQGEAPCRLEDWFLPPQPAKPQSAPMADFPTLDLEELLESLESGSLQEGSCALSLQEGRDTLWCSVANRCLSLTQSSQLSQKRGTDPVLISTMPPQGHLTVFQNTNNNNMSMFYPESSGLTDFQQAGQSLHQHPTKSPLYPDPTLGGFTRA